MTVTPVYAQWDMLSYQEGFFLVARIVVSILAGLVGWFAAAPLSHILYRLAFHRPQPKITQFVVRCLAAMLLGILTFLFFPIGFGGSGFGLGPGAGPGQGGGGTGQKDGKATGKGGGTSPGDEEPKKSLPIALVVSKEYEPNSGKYYLINDAKPARTLNEVKEYLLEHKGRFGRLKIIIYANSISEEHPAVQALRNLADRMRLTPEVPPEYHTKIRTGEAAEPPAKPDESPGG